MYYTYILLCLFIMDLLQLGKYDCGLLSEAFKKLEDNNSKAE